jgi:hypothetical protein
MFLFLYIPIISYLHHKYILPIKRAKYSKNHFSPKVLVTHFWTTFILKLEGKVASRNPYHLPVEDAPEWYNLDDIGRL